MLQMTSNSCYSYGNCSINRLQGNNTIVKSGIVRTIEKYYRTYNNLSMTHITTKTATMTMDKE